MTPAPSDWILRWAPLLLRPGASVLDLACGSGRHLRWLAAQGFAVTGVDRDAAALAPLAALAETRLADLEDGSPWPLGGRRFDAMVVTNYLWRGLFPRLVSALAPGGVLLYETFADGQQHVGRPTNPEFLLQPGELLQRCAGLHVLAFEDGWLADEGGIARRVQRIAARASATPAEGPRGSWLAPPIAAAGAPGPHR